MCVFFRVRRGFFGFASLSASVGRQPATQTICVALACLCRTRRRGLTAVPPSFPLCAFPRVVRPCILSFSLSPPLPPIRNTHSYFCSPRELSVFCLRTRKKKKPKKLKNPKPQPTRRRRRRTIPIASSRLLAVFVSLLLLLRSFVSPPTCSPPGLICCVELREKERPK